MSEQNEIILKIDEECKYYAETIQQILMEIKIILAEFDLEDKFNPMDIDENMISQLQNADLEPDQKIKVNELIRLLVEYQTL